MNRRNMLRAFSVFLGLSVAPPKLWAASAPEGLRKAWRAWEAGDFALAEKLASALVKQERRSDEARHLLTLTMIVRGAYNEAVANYWQINPRYERLAQLDEAMLWALVHQGDLTAAHKFAERRGLLKDDVTAERLRLAREYPFGVQLTGIADLPFSDDELSPFMPGVAVCLNGQDTVARLDTGGAFLHLTPALAEKFGVKPVVCEREFFGLIQGNACYGVAKSLEIGPIRLQNVPVAILEGLPAEAIAANFGVELGPIIGTNILQRFLTTVDGPKRRFILSRRGDANARKAHFSRIAHSPKTRHETPFVLWGSHYMIARGRVGRFAPENFFMDSGLVAANQDQGQVALLVSESVLHKWRVQKPKADHFAELPSPLEIGGASRANATAFTVSDAKWREFGDWGGIRVDALASWGFFKHFTWTIDFDRHVYLFEEQ
jgi:hypothetical protein